MTELAARKLPKFYWRPRPFWGISIGYLFRTIGSYFHPTEPETTSQGLPNMMLLAHLTEVEFPALAMAYGAGIATGAFAALVLFRWRAR